MDTPKFKDQYVDRMATWAYELADAMIKERGKDIHQKEENNDLDK